MFRGIRKLLRLRPLVGSPAPGARHALPRRSLARASVISVALSSLFLVPLAPSTLSANAVLANGSDSEVDYALSVNQTNYGSVSGSDSYPNISSNFTVEAWLYPTETRSLGAYFAKEFSFVFAINSGEYSWAFGNGNVNGWSSPAWYSTGVKANLNAWQHAVFVKEGTVIRFYLDGQLAFQQDLVFSAVSSGSTYPLTVGFRGGTEYLVGKIDEVRVWSTARTADQIAQPLAISKTY